MLFQSQFYVLAFLPVVVASYYAVAGSERARHWVLIASSLFFYSWWDAGSFLSCLVKLAPPGFLQHGTSVAVRRHRCELESFVVLPICQAATN